MFFCLYLAPVLAVVKSCCDQGFWEALHSNETLNIFAAGFRDVNIGALTRSMEKGKIEIFRGTYFVVGVGANGTVVIRDQMG